MDRRARLVVQVRAHQPTDEAEAGHRHAILDLLVGEGDAFARDHWTPGHVTCSAFVLHPTEPALLLIHHTALDRWLQPGGHVEPEDVDTEAAARREVAEETGVRELTVVSEGPFDLDVHAIPARGEAPGHLHHDVRWLLRAGSASLVRTGEVRDVAWVPLAELAGRGVDESVLRAVRTITSRGLA